MLEMNYRPKYFKCKLKGIIQESCGSRFQFEEVNDDIALSYILVDESVERINTRIQEVLQGTRYKVYLTYGMRNIDLEKTPSGKWQLFDEFNIYEFEM
jgi:hypothetical protein